MTFPRRTVGLTLVATALIYFIYSQFLYLDIENGCTIVLMPSFQPSNLSTRETITFLKKSSLEEYSKLCQHVNVINKNPSCGGLDGGCYKPTEPRTIYIGNDQNNIALAAALLVHETCHAIQSQSNKGLSEGDCYKEGSQYLKNITLVP